MSQRLALKDIEAQEEESQGCFGHLEGTNEETTPSSALIQRKLRRQEWFTGTLLADMLSEEGMIVYLIAESRELERTTAINGIDM
ncbi:hypothetical protein AB1N83_012842 [Pleurotus pulmonarius]